MTRALILCVLFASTLASCTQRMICPAYQSAFIFDKPTQKEKFVYYNDNPKASKDFLASNSKTITLPARDSSWDKSTVLPGPALPQPRRVKKDRYLLLPDKTYKQAMRSLMTVEMKQVLPKIKPDSADIQAELDSAARSITDTITAVDAGKKKPQAEDSVYAITKTKEKYNNDQDLYMWYFRDVLVMPDVRAANQNKAKEKKEGEADKKSSKDKKGLSKKNKQSSQQKVDSVSDSTSTDKPKEKKSLNPFKKKKSEAPQQEKKKAETPKKDEDDGF